MVLVGDGVCSVFFNVADGDEVADVMGVACVLGADVAGADDGDFESFHGWVAIIRLPYLKNDRKWSDLVRVSP